MGISALRKNLIEILYVSIFIFIYFISIYIYYVVPNNNNVSILVFIGIAFVILGIFFFINLDHKNGNSIFLNFKILSENSIKVILVIFMSLALIIRPITSPTTIILWSDVGVLNYIRSFVFIIGIGYLPGANLYNIIFPKNDLHERFKVEPFLLKITIYPLLSFLFLGLSVLILDQIGLMREMFEILLFSIIMVLFFSDLMVQYIRNNKISFKFEKMNLSKYTLIILIISLGILLFSVSIHLGTQYLIVGDSWVGLASTNYIGRSGTSPIRWGEVYYYYPIFWAYICFGFSILSGLPYININALLAPYCYLYVPSLYLLTKSILYQLKEKYAVLSTALITISSGLFIFTSNTAVGNLPALTFTVEFYFIYKSYSYLLLIFALSLFIIILKTNEEKNAFNEKIIKINNFKLLFLVALFLVISFMLYLLPLLMGLFFIFLYCLFSENKRKNFQLLKYLTALIGVIFISLDILMNFYLSSSMFNMVQWFFPIQSLQQILSLIPIYILIYFLFGCLYALMTIIQFLSSKDYNKERNFISKYKLNSKNIFKFSLIIFTALLIIEIIILLEEVFLNLNFKQNFTFFYYLDKILINIGFVGIIGVYFSYYCFLKDKKLFFILISWILICILIGSTLIFMFWFQSNSLKLNEIEKSSRLLMNNWYNRNWTYAIIPLGILASIGLIKLSKLVNNIEVFKKIITNKKRKKLFNFSALSLLIVLSTSNLIFAGINIGSFNSKPSDEEIDMLSWMSENLPIDSKILIEENYIIRLGIITIVNGYYYIIDDIFESNYNQTENIQELEDLKDIKIEYLLVSKDFLNENSNRSIFFKSYLIPNFYNESEHKTRHLWLYYAPYFD